MRELVFEPDAPYNAAFFNGLTNVFLLYKEHHGEDEALDFFTELMETNLKPAYDSERFTKGDPHSFARTVGNRDKSVGLKVGLEVSPDRVVYRFYDDPFPNLRNHVDRERLDATYMKFKVRYLLGNNWNYRTTHHIWDNNTAYPFTEHIIEHDNSKLHAGFKEVLEEVHA